MEVYLAGYNIDTNVLKELEEKTGKRDDVTPEVISAAYARISRDPRPVNEIREDARVEVEKTRKSNSTIIFKMGHHSVAEHAVFNLDVLGVSRFAMEELEKFRLCSYTEKSQRYITLEKDFVIPREMKGSGFENTFTAMIGRQNETYFQLFEKLKEYVFEKHSELAKDSKNHNLLEGWAKEDARYVTSLSTESQVGMTINARNLELLLRRFASHPLQEVKDLGRSLYNQIVEVAPSIVIFHAENDLDRDTYPQLCDHAKDIISDLSANPVSEEVLLTDYTRDADAAIAAALLHTSSNLSYEQCRTAAQKMSREELMQMFKTTWQNMQLYDSVLREFEYVNLTYDIVLSSACFGQLKRHRMATITSQQYDPALGITIPESIKEIGMQSDFQQIANESAELYSEIKKEIPLAAPYILTNAHRKRILMRVNARELYHISRLREDKHAQWDIRNVSLAMSEQAKNVMPLLFNLIGAKDSYNEIFQSVFGREPKVVEAVLPGARKIK